MNATLVFAILSFLFYNLDQLQAATGYVIGVTR